MKTISFLLLLLIAGICATAQTDTLLYEAYYHLTKDEPGKTIQQTSEESILIIGNNQLLMRDYIALKKDSIYWFQQLLALGQSLDEINKSYSIRVISMPSLDGQMIIDLNGKTVKYFRNMVRHFYYEFPLETYKWTHLKDTSTILDYHCLRATGTSNKGKHWEVWYSKQIPAPGSLWGLNGLPGLVLKANETTNHVAFELTRLKKGSSFYSISMPQYSEKVTMEKMQELNDEHEKDRKAFMMKYAPPGVTYKLGN